MNHCYRILIKHFNVYPPLSCLDHTLDKCDTGSGDGSRYLIVSSKNRVTARCDRRQPFEFSSIQFSLIQFSSRWYLCTWKIPYALYPVYRKFPQCCLWNSSRVCLISSFQARFLLSTSSFHTSLLWAIGDVITLALWPQVVSQAPQHFRPVSSSSTFQTFWDASHLPASLSARSFPFTSACPAQYIHRSFWRWMHVDRCHIPDDTFQSGLPIPFFTFCGKLIESVRSS